MRRVLLFGIGWLGAATVVPATLVAQGGASGTTGNPNRPSRVLAWTPMANELVTSWNSLGIAAGRAAQSYDRSLRIGGSAAFTVDTIETWARVANQQLEALIEEVDRTSALKAFIPELRRLAVAPMLDTGGAISLRRTSLVRYCPLANGRPATLSEVTRRAISIVCVEQAVASGVAELKSELRDVLSRASIANITELVASAPRPESTAIDAVRTSLQKLTTVVGRIDTAVERIDTLLNRHAPAESTTVTIHIIRADSVHRASDRRRLIVSAALSALGGFALRAALRP